MSKIETNYTSSPDEQRLDIQTSSTSKKYEGFKVGTLPHFDLKKTHEPGEAKKEKTPETPSPSPTTKKPEAPKDYLAEVKAKTGSENWQPVKNTEPQGLIKDRIDKTTGKWYKTGPDGKEYCFTDHILAGKDQARITEHNTILATLTTGKDFFRRDVVGQTVRSTVTTKGENKQDIIEGKVFGTFITVNEKGEISFKCFEEGMVKKPPLPSTNRNTAENRTQGEPTQAPENNFTISGESEKQEQNIIRSTPAANTAKIESKQTSTLLTEQKQQTSFTKETTPLKTQITEKSEKKVNLNEISPLTLVNTKTEYTSTPKPETQQQDIDWLDAPVPHIESPHTDILFKEQSFFQPEVTEKITITAHDKKEPAYQEHTIKTFNYHKQPISISPTLLSPPQTKSLQTKGIAVIEYSSPVQDLLQQPITLQTPQLKTTNEYQEKKETTIPTDELMPIMKTRTTEITPKKSLELDSITPKNHTSKPLTIANYQQVSGIFLRNETTLVESSLEPTTPLPQKQAEDTETTTTSHLVRELERAMTNKSTVNHPSPIEDEELPALPYPLKIQREHLFSTI